ncbi:Caspase-7 [Chamberlinius hualienensis]
MYTQYRAYPSENNYDLKVIRYSVARETAKMLSYELCKKPGKCMIFTHKYYCDILKLNKRKDAHKNVDIIKATFGKLGFSEIETHQDLNKEDIFTNLIKATSSDFGDYSGLFVFILTHGTKNHSLAARDNFYSFKRLVENVLRNPHPSLIGKPKIFIIQACSGEHYDYGATAAYGSLSNQPEHKQKQPDEKIKVDARPFSPQQSIQTAIGDQSADTKNVEQTSLFLPKSPDILFTFASAPSKRRNYTVSFRSLFIPRFCQVLEKYHDKIDVEKILTLTRQWVAQETLKDYNGKEVKQIPLTVSTLTKKFTIK